MNLLEMKHVKKKFDNLEVLKDISIEVKEGEVVSFSLAVAVATASGS